MLKFCHCSCVVCIPSLSFSNTSCFLQKAKIFIYFAGSSIWGWAIDLSFTKFCILSSCVRSWWIQVLNKAFWIKKSSYFSEIILKFRPWWVVPKSPISTICTHSEHWAGIFFPSYLQYAYFLQKKYCAPGWNLTGKANAWLLTEPKSGGGRGSPPQILVDRLTFISIEGRLRPPNCYLPSHLDF